MKNSMIRKVVPLLALVALAVVGWLIWKSLNDKPVYSQSHAHSSEMHEHSHTHGDGLDHGHEHVGMDGSETHSHPHQHGHQHASDSDSASVKGLTEVGHVHATDGNTQLYWAKAVVDGRQVELELFRQDGDEQELVDYRPSAAGFEAKLFNGSKLEGDLKIARADDKFVGSLPDDFFCLPTHVLQFKKLMLGGEEFESVVPLTKTIAEDE